MAGTAIGSGEGGILPEELAAAHRYILEYVPNRYGITDENLKRVDAIEIKIGQSTHPGMGAILPGKKVTREIAGVRGYPEGIDIVSPAHYDDIKNRDDLKKKVSWLRTRSGRKPIGVKIAAGHIEEDLEIVTYAEPDFITIDGRPGATSAAPKFIKMRHRYRHSLPCTGHGITLTEREQRISRSLSPAGFGSLRISRKPLQWVQMPAQSGTLR